MSESNPEVQRRDQPSSAEPRPSGPVAGTAVVDQVADPRPGQEKLAPRQFSLSTLLVATALYALLFGLLRAGGASPVSVLAMTLFVTSIGLGQRFLFHGKRPHATSFIVGACFVLGLEAFHDTAGRGIVHGDSFSFPGDVMAGAFAGWLCGRYIAVGFAMGFSVLDQLKRLLGVRPR